MPPHPEPQDAFDSAGDGKRGEGRPSDFVENVYGCLRDVARAHFGSDRAGHTLQPTAIVHEAFLRLSGNETLELEGREHFLAVASRAMRHVLVDHARRKLADKRGGGRRRVTLAGIGTDATGEYDALEVNEALDKLERRSSRQARIVELRFFGGLRVEDVAQVLDVSERTVRNEWRVARAWLRGELASSDSDAPEADTFS